MDYSSSGTRRKQNIEKKTKYINILENEGKKRSLRLTGLTLLVRDSLLKFEIQKVLIFKNTLINFFLSQRKNHDISKSKKYLYSKIP